MARGPVPEGCPIQPAYPRAPNAVTGSPNATPRHATPRHVLDGLPDKVRHGASATLRRAPSPTLQALRSKARLPHPREPTRLGSTLHCRTARLSSAASARLGKLECCATPATPATPCPQARNGTPRRLKKRPELNALVHRESADDRVVRVFIL